MKKMCGLIFFISLSISAIAQYNTIHLNGKDYYINGVNIPWNNFGWDFGRHEEWGVGYDSEWFESTFNELASNGVNCFRIWVHCDGRANPNFDAEGYVSGLDDNFLAQLDDIVVRANAHSLMVVITLWSHDMMEDNVDGAGVFAGLHADLISDLSKSYSYIENALTPMVEHLSDHCNILAWEIMNEPEWGMDIDYGGTTAQTVSKKDMQRFIGLCVETIRIHTDHNITIGAAKPFGNGSSGEHNYWHEREFHDLGFDCTQVYFDFYCFHFYDWMGEGLSPFEREADFWELGKPVIIAETSSSSFGISEDMNPEEQLKTCAENNYAGILFWSYNANDDFSDWDNCKSFLKDFSVKNNLPSYNENCVAPSIEQPLIVCSVFPNPVSNVLNLSIHYPDQSYHAEGYLLNAAGQIVHSFYLSTDELQIDVRKLPAGFYYLVFKIFGENSSFIQQQAQKITLINSSN